jgi:pyridinium-3,5-biscarboxylic acid mononucleotide synthase
VNAEAMRALLENVRNGTVAPDDALETLRELPFQEMGFAKVDHHRVLRRGFPEVIFCPGKTVPQIAEIAHSIHARGNTLLATRTDEAAYEAVRERVPDAQFDATARIIWAQGSEKLQLPGTLGVLSAGTGDIPVAEEAAVCAEVMGASVQRIYDIGVAGLHRLLSQLETIRSCDVLIAVAGMEGAMPSVLGGLVQAPVIAVPTSIGYGANLGGVAALLGMLNSCAGGVSVVNIDNGFGAAMCAAAILRKLKQDT